MSIEEEIQLKMARYIDNVINFDEFTDFMRLIFETKIKILDPDKNKTLAKFVSGIIQRMVLVEAGGLPERQLKESLLDLLL